MSSYFIRTGESSYTATEHTTGAWDISDQHIALPIGLLAHVLETDFVQRRDDPLFLARMSVDILGTIPVTEVDYSVRVIRPGRTVELVEAALSHAGRTAVQMRGWFMAQQDTAAIAGTGFTPIATPHEHEPSDPSEDWPGGALADLSCRRLKREPGRGSFWLSQSIPLVDDSPVSTVAQAASLFDFANGMVARADPQRVFFPNLDLTAHLIRPPAQGPVGFDTSVSFGDNGVGLTHSVLHDVMGPIGSLAQALTVRPRT